ncbi:MAG: hypothetical protein AB8B57_07490 [Congregibacter sp.]
MLSAAFERKDDASLANDHAILAILVDESAAFSELMQSEDLRYFRQDIDEPEDMLMRVAHRYPAVDYVQTQRRRILLMQGMAKLFDTLDVLAAPFSGSPQQSATSLTGHPSVPVQNGFDGRGRPTGIQFIGQLYGEAEALTVARHYQARAPWYRQYPSAFR